MTQFCKDYHQNAPISLSVYVKLDDDNYLIWRKQMLSYITTFGLESFIDESTFKPYKFLPNGTINPSFINWTTLNSMLKG